GEGPTGRRSREGVGITHGSAGWLEADEDAAQGRPLGGPHTSLAPDLLARDPLQRGRCRISSWTGRVPGGTRLGASDAPPATGRGGRAQRGSAAVLDGQSLPVVGVGPERRVLVQDADEI